MEKDFSKKSTVDEIRERFDKNVERFTNLESGQQAMPDAPLMLELTTAAAARVNPEARAFADLGCGAGNFSLKLLEKIPDLDVTLVDLSRPMLDRALERVGPATRGATVAVQKDIREVDLGAERFDIVMAAAMLHHLRSDEEWESVFSMIHRCLKPGGAFWISDMIEHDDPRLEALFRERYGEYLFGVGGIELREKVFDYIYEEDTPRSLVFQLDLLRRVGFASVEVLHKSVVAAAFGGIKAPGRRG